MQTLQIQYQHLIFYELEKLHRFFINYRTLLCILYFITCGVFRCEKQVDVITVTFAFVKFSFIAMTHSEYSIAKFKNVNFV